MRGLIEGSGVHVSTIDESAEAPGAPSTRPRVLITGTGRAGTTLLVQVLTDLGLDTGFTPESAINPDARAGLEKRLDDPDAPRIVKSPNVIRRLDALLASGAVALEHVIIPMRDLDVAAASRVRNTGYGSNLAARGGLLGTLYATKQREALALLQYQLMYTLAVHDVPHTLLLFPRFASDWEYLHRKLAFLDPTVPEGRWQAAVESRLRPDFIHETPLSRKEEVLARAGTTYNRTIVRPARAVRKLVRGEPRGPRRPKP
jgi:hypothetical protein